MDPYEQIGQGIATIDFVVMLFFISRAFSSYRNSKRLGDNERAKNSYKGVLKGCLIVIVLNVIVISILALVIG